MKATRQNYHLYIHKVLAQLSLHLEAQPSPVDFKLEFSLPELLAVLFVERANERRGREENEAEATISVT